MPLLLMVGSSKQARQQDDISNVTATAPHEHCLDKTCGGGTGQEEEEVEKAVVHAGCKCECKLSLPTREQIESSGHVTL